MPNLPQIRLPPTFDETRKETPPLPTIRVEDWNETPPLASMYMCGENVVLTDDVFSLCKSLLSHPGRGQLTVQYDRAAKYLRVRECTQEFVTSLWKCFANIIDYFADFAHNDRPAMRSVWFHMIDVLQTVITRLPHQFYERAVPSCRHAKIFATDYKDLLKLLNDVIVPHYANSLVDVVRTNKDVMRRSLVDLRGHKAGLKPWEQYLRHKAPGFDVPYRWHIHNERARVGVGIPNVWPEQLVPMGGLAIIDRHTARARRLVSKAFPADQESEGKPSEADMLDDFDAHAIDLANPIMTYTSLDGRLKTAEKMHPLTGTPGEPRKYEGLGDPSCIADEPDFNLLNECVGIHKGDDGYIHPDGNERRQFHMLSIRTMPTTVPPPPPTSIEADKYNEIFDEWAERVI